MDSRRTVQAEAVGYGLVIEPSPDANGRPEGEGFLWSPQDHEAVPVTKPHLLRCNDAMEALERWLAEQGREGYVGSDQNVYWDIENLRRTVAPDVFVAFGVSGKPRGNYRVWVEGPPPSFVLEILSPSTRKRDLGEKKAIYEEMGVLEYFVFEGKRDGEANEDDRQRRYGPRISPALQGFRLYTPDLGRPLYRRIPAQTGGLRGGARVMVGYASEVLGLDVVWAASKDGDRVRFYDLANNRFILNVGDGERLRADGEKRRADEAEARIDEERRRADEERRRADEAEAQTEAVLVELAELRRQLAQRE